MKKRILSMVLAITMVMALIGCGSSSSSSSSSSDDTTEETTEETTSAASGETTTITIWMPPFGDEDVTDLEFWNEQLADVREEYNVELSIEVIPWANYEEKYMTGIASGAGPDIGYMYNEMIMEYVEAGQLVDLDEYFTDEDTADYIYWDNGLINGVQYMLPFVVGNPRIVYCNMDLLAEAGIDSVPTTWEELEETALAVQEATGVQGYQQFWGGTFGDLNELLWAYFWQAGGDTWYDEDGNFGEDYDELLKAIERIEGLMEDGVITESSLSMTGSDVSDAFSAGTVAMIDYSTSAADDFTEAGINWDYTLLCDETYGTFVANDSLVMLESCENKEIAAAVMKAMTSPSVMEAFHETLYAMPPINYSEAYCDNEVFEEFYDEYAEYFHSLPIVADSTNTYTQLHTNIQMMLMGELTAQEVLDNTIAYSSQ